MICTGIVDNHFGCSQARQYIDPNRLDILGNLLN
jgi:hypothetical protein